ncbi:hypothetical protein AD928_00285 [Acetobacter cerevisiae]|uniref:Uncharacterized protein n=1 Tax=Acetobacter cerevisiae TaxID=178900 RepID=A0A149R1K1_9PROT|nr:hypothetical protein AD928_00285 [Acetobacter cerevisiae]
MVAQNIDIDRQKRIGDFPQCLLDFPTSPEAVMCKGGIRAGEACCTGRMDDVTIERTALEQAGKRFLLSALRP